MLRSVVFFCFFFTKMSVEVMKVPPSPAFSTPFWCLRELIHHFNHSYK